MYTSWNSNFTKVSLKVLSKTGTIQNPIIALETLENSNLENPTNLFLITYFLKSSVCFAAFSIC
jgi:hypothetical protein